jgi:hypothetical protein
MTPVLRHSPDQERETFAARRPHIESGPKWRQLLVPLAFTDRAAITGVLDHHAHERHPL